MELLETNEIIGSTMGESQPVGTHASSVVHTLMYQHVGTCGSKRNDHKTFMKGGRLQ